MNIRPKQWRAIVDFAVDTEQYAKGDLVPSTSPHLARLIGFGGFVEETVASATTTRKPKPTTPTVKETNDAVRDAR